MHTLLKAKAQADHVVERAYEPVAKILRARGWEYTSDSPGCYWLWQKKLKDGRTVLCTLETAVRFEIEESGEEWPVTPGGCHRDEG